MIRMNRLGIQQNLHVAEYAVIGTLYFFFWYVGSTLLLPQLDLTLIVPKAYIFLMMLIYLIKTPSFL